MNRLLCLVCAALVCAVALAACGSSGKPSAAASSGASQGIKYADCMRKHGVPSFPDPSPNGGVNLPSSINSRAPAFQSAQQACANMQPNANGPRPAISAAQQKAFVANARCMRKHGVPSFPDPSFGPGGRAISFNVRAGAFRSQSAALNLANKACAHIGTPLPLGGLVRP
jgi:hypothetical protein